MKNLIILLAFFIFNTSVYAQNNCLDFDGTDDYVNCGTSSTLKPTSAITVEAWINVNSIGIYEGVVSNLQDNGSDESGYCLYFKDGKITWWLKTVNGPINFSTNAPNASISTGSWYHIAGTYDGSYLRLYVNGIFMDSYATTGNIDWTHSPLGFYIGALKDDNENYYYDGKIDEVRVWNDARTETEIRQNMYQELNGNESGLVAYYQFNEASGTTADNTEGTSTYDGTLTNMDNSDWQTSSAMFGPKNCLDFDGTDDYVLLPNNLYTGNLQGGTEITIEYWFKGSQLYSPVRFQNEGYIVTGWSDPPQFIISSDGLTSGVVIGEQADIEDNKWHHIACVWKSNTVNGFQTYVDGVLSNQRTSANVTLPTISSGGAIGTFKYSTGIQEMLNGQIDEVRIWNTARTASEIRENMMRTLNGNESGLVAYYTFDNTTGNKLQDFSGNGNDGTLNNMNNSDWVSSSAFNTWLNTSSNSWGTVSNWSLGSAPTSTHNVGIYNWSATAPAISGSPSMQNLIVGPNACPTVGSNFSVSGNLIVQSNLALDDFTADLGSTGQLIEEGGLLCSSTGHLNFCSDFNNISSLNIGGLGAMISCSANMGSTTVKRYHNPIIGDGGDQSINRYYIIDPANNSNLDATLVFHYDDSELNNNVENDLVLYKSEDQGQSWIAVGGTLDATNNTITLSGISNFSWWTAAESGKILPVSLLKFEGSYQGAEVSLEWSTASEINARNFVIQKSENGIDFSDLLSVPAAGNSNQIINYRITDSEVKNGQIYYYQLIENDFDGTIQKLGIISVLCVGQSGFEIIEKIYPNPVHDLLYFQLNNNYSCSINLLNSLGETLQKIEVKDGVELQYVDMNQYPAGIYYLEVISSDTKQTIKFVK